MAYGRPSPMKTLMICEPTALATAPGPNPFFAMATDARQSGTCAPHASTVTPSRSSDIPMASQANFALSRMSSASSET